MKTFATGLQVSAVYEPAEDGWIVATIHEVPGTFSQGRTRDEARRNVIDALRLKLTPSPSQHNGQHRERIRLTVAI
jgi:predicted RNase H-like HicB family nuclease